MSITCGGCDNTWTGVSRCHCGGCHELFSGLALFDRHRVNGKCLDPATVKTKPKDGSPAVRAMYLTDGVWYGVENPVGPGAQLQEWRRNKKGER